MRVSEQSQGVGQVLVAWPRFVAAPLYRRWHLRWGATDVEVAAAMPGDEHREAIVGTRARHARRYPPPGYTQHGMALSRRSAGRTDEHRTTSRRQAAWPF
jgi:hypothetical protein